MTTFWHYLGHSCNMCFLGFAKFTHFHSDSHDRIKFTHFRHITWSRFLLIFHDFRNLDAEKYLAFWSYFSDRKRHCKVLMWHKVPMDRYSKKVSLPENTLLVKSLFRRFLTLFDIPISRVGDTFCTTFLHNYLFRGLQKQGQFSVKKWSKNGRFGAVNVPKLTHHQKSTMRGFWKAVLTPLLAADPFSSPPPPWAATYRLWGLFLQNS